LAKERILIGLHSGPAADGVDAAAIAVTGKGERMKVRQVAWTRQPYPDELSAGLAALPSADNDRLEALDADLTARFARAAQAVLRAAGVLPEQAAACGVIGSALPGGMGLELPACPRLRLALDVTLAGEFARGDLAAGGMGRPPTAWAHWLLLRDRRLSRALVELGGLARLTFLGSSCRADEVQSFDVVPAGVLLDELTRKHFAQPCDRDGAIAAGGRVSGELLNQLDAHPFLHRPPPRATTAGDWRGLFVERLELRARNLACRAEDLVATVTEWIARAVARSVLAMSERPHEVILSGGGSANIHLAGRIRTLLSPSSTYALQRYGFEAQAMGAVSAGVLAAARVDGHPAGTRQRTVLGGLW